MFAVSRSFPPATTASCSPVFGLLISSHSQSLSFNPRSFLSSEVDRARQAETVERASERGCHLGGLRKCSLLTRGRPAKSCHSLAADLGPSADLPCSTIDGIYLLISFLSCSQQGPGGTVTLGGGWSRRANKGQELSMASLHLG